MRRDLQDQARAVGCPTADAQPCTISLGIGQIAADETAEQPTSQTGSSRD
jgi:hypothetical protein